MARGMERVGSKIADGAVLEVVESFLQAKVMETVEGWTPEQGTPQGAVLSPLLSNLYLDPLDHAMAEEGHEMVRYADDFVVLCRSQAGARRVAEMDGASRPEATSEEDPHRGCYATGRL